MARVSPLNQIHARAGALTAPYGPPDGQSIEVVQTFAPPTDPDDPHAGPAGGPEFEYAALRKHTALFDLPTRGTLEVRTGGSGGEAGDRLDFLNRMVTQDLKPLQPFHTTRSFWLTRKGRIDADLRLIELPDRTLIDLDAHAAERTAAGLSSFLFTEDVQITDRTDAMHRLALHGPAAPALLARVSEPVAGAAVLELTPGRAAVLRIEGREVVADRQDSTGVPGFELLMAVEDAAAVYTALARPPHPLDDAAPPHAGDRPRRAARAGWHAYNTARIEAGWPIYYLDFGPDSLPHETGVLDDRVSFKKGCYLGQEIVARMQSLGHPKARLVGLRPQPGRDAIETNRPDAPGGSPEGGGGSPQPVTGAPITVTPAPDSDVIGAVTSSAISPMLGALPICFAMVKYKHTEPGTTLYIHADGSPPLPLSVIVQPSLTFWRSA